MSGFKFQLDEHVRKVGEQRTGTLKEIREMPGDETLYWIQFGTDFTSRMWTKERELERAE